ncbi:MAG TPA: SpoIID/LytB domain-containing protein [Solirubrobacteraceae bacterium]|nr:SpoIID/LytB domain-containing protein [Solirubrobacteraceae bacterium]
MALAGALLALAVAAPTAGAWQQLVVEGAGEGHGVGMSQDGALGLAEHGYTDAEILSHYYPGTALATAPANTVVKVLVGSKVQRVPLERYVRGVVSAEMPSSWPLAALEAQAIACRTYAMTAHAGGSRFDVYSDTRSQVYKGAAAETAQTNAAVAATAGQVVTYAGKPAITYFFASSGGHTEDVQNVFEGSEPSPWLQGVSDPYETTASHWRYTLTDRTAAARLSGLFKGTLRGIEVLRRGVSPRIVLAAVLGSGGDTHVSGATLEYRLGLPSTWAYFSLRTGSTTVPEPDLSGHAETGTSTTTPPASPQPPGATTEISAEGGSKAPAPAPSGTGGASAG